MRLATVNAMGKGLIETGGWRRHEIVCSLDTGQLMGVALATDGRNLAAVTTVLVWECVSVTLRWRYSHSMPSHSEPVR